MLSSFPDFLVNIAHIGKRPQFGATPEWRRSRRSEMLRVTPFAPATAPQ